MAAQLQALLGDAFVLDTLGLNGLGAVGLLLPLFVFGEVAFEELHLALILVVEDVGGDTVEEPAVVRDHHGRAGEVQQGFFQCAQGFHVKVVGWFVQQQKVAALFQGQCQVQAATQVRPGRFIWATLAMKPARLTQIQHRNSQLKQVKIILTGPQSVEIAVKEYDVIGLVNAGKRPQLLLSNGKFRPVTGQVDQFVAYAGFNDHYPMLKTTAKRIGKLAPAVRNGISEVTYSPTTLDKQRLKLLMNDGNTVFVKASEIDEKMSYYPSIVANTDGNRVINLEFGAYSYEYSSKDK